MPTSCTWHLRPLESHSPSFLSLIPAPQAQQGFHEPKQPCLPLTRLPSHLLAFAGTVHVQEGSVWDKQGKTVFLLHSVHTISRPPALPDGGGQQTQNGIEIQSPANLRGSWSRSLIHGHMTSSWAQALSSAAHCLASWSLGPILWRKGQVFGKPEGQRLGKERRPGVRAERACAVFSAPCRVALDNPHPSLSPVSSTVKPGLRCCPFRGIDKWQMVLSRGLTISPRQMEGPGSCSPVPCAPTCSGCETLGPTERRGALPGPETTQGVKVQAVLG